MKKKFAGAFLFSFFYFCAGTMQAQSVFQKIYSDTSIGGLTQSKYCTGAVRTFEGGVAMCGTVNWGHPYSNLFLVKTDANGDLVWGKTYGDTSIEVAYGMEQTVDSGYILIGYSSSYGPTGSIFLVRTDKVGNLIWSKNFQADNLEGRVIRKTNDGGFIIGGSSHFWNTYTNWDFCLVKIDSLGSILWSKSYGGYTQELAYDLQITSDGGFVMVGSSYSNSNVYVVKTDVDGNLEWAKNYDGGNYETGVRIKQAEDNGFMVTGFTSSFSSPYEKYLFMKINQSGNLQWAKTYSDSDWLMAYDFVQTQDHGYAIAGIAGNKKLNFLKTDSNGNIDWVTEYKETQCESGLCILSNADGGWTIAGSKGNDTCPNPEAVVYLIKTDTDGYTGCEDTHPTVFAVNNVVPYLDSTGTFEDTISLISSSVVPFVSDLHITQQVLCEESGVHETASSDFDMKLYPNPAASLLNITLPQSSSSVQLTIKNILGKTMDEEKLSVDHAVIDVQDFPAGIYLIELNFGDHITSTKLIKAAQ